MMSSLLCTMVSYLVPMPIVCASRIPGGDSLIRILTLALYFNIVKLFVSCLVFGSALD